MPLNEKSHNTVVLIFADDAKNDARRKNLDAAKTAFDFLIEKTVSVVQQTGLPYILHTRDLQQGTTFGERYDHALQSAFDQGYEKVVSIGTDTPALSATHLLQASQRISEGQVVLGKSHDGGFYLLGIDKYAFAKARQPHSHLDSFENLPWHSERVARALVRLLSQQRNTIFYLEKLHDLDAFEDFKKILDSGNLNCKITIDLFKSLIHIENDLVISFSNFKKRTPLKILGNKGSPLAA
ncbi:hypothetical protein BST97_12845 [Nonlabens spongiae]|uniref:DUF2064 domain-containing protein n=1 Tax=Nonlabens spongiae TaxID=331648 RepID=A0A1W6MMH9_9FLAO|nr:hypothetical protein BST97_12845 [Nonlabens spongiae]